MDVSPLYHQDLRVGSPTIQHQEEHALHRHQGIKEEVSKLYDHVGMEVLARIAARNDIGLASFKMEMTTLLGSKRDKVK